MCDWSHINLLNVAPLATSAPRCCCYWLAVGHCTRSRRWCHKSNNVARKFSCIFPPSFSLKKSEQRILKCITTAGIIIIIITRRYAKSGKIKVKLVCWLGYGWVVDTTLHFINFSAAVMLPTVVVMGILVLASTKPANICETISIHPTKLYYQTTA